MTMYLTDDVLGRLDLGPTPAEIVAETCGNTGYVVTGWQVGFPTVREVTRPRALGDGEIDDTRFVGARVISGEITIDHRVGGDAQLLFDALAPFLSPRRRPRLHWTVPESTQVRSAIVRGVDMPMVVERSKFNAIVAQWKCPSGVIEAPVISKIVIQPSGDVEEGRHYGAPADQFGPYYTNASGEVGRQYPLSIPAGTRIVTNNGNSVADWIITIFGEVENPTLTINGTTMSFDQNGGETINAGSSITINSADRTILFNNDPTQSRYNKVNFADWSWDDFRLQPGMNLVGYSGDVVGVTSSLHMSYRDSYL